jgi:hypothetical protein
LWTILAAQLVLPVGTFFKFPMIPQFDKNSIPSLCALLGCMVVYAKPLRLWNRFGIPEVLLTAYLVSPLVTSTLNGDPIQIGRTVLPGVDLYDGGSTFLGQLIALLPFFLGRQFLRGPGDIHQILYVLAIAGVAYSPLLLYEIRFSPQLNFWIYGYYPSDFIQEMRGDGSFRPMAFMGHGLISSFFVMTALLASTVLWRARMGFSRSKAGIFTFYLGMVLYFCKSGAALAYGLALAPVMRFTQPKFQIRLALIFAVVALTYPMLRIAEVFPTKALVDVSDAFNPARAGSLNFRFEQEESLLEHASQRIWFGWGRFGRNRLFREDWQGLAGDTSVTDGRWIIVFGQFGLVGFLAEFGLICIPIFRAAKAIRLVVSRVESYFLSAVSLIVAINAIDLLPNSTLSPWTWMLAGSLLGRSEAILNRVRTPIRRDRLVVQYG